MRILKRIWEAFCSPGKPTTISCAAPNQFVSSEKDQNDEYKLIGDELVDENKIYSPLQKKPLGSRIFDEVTKLAGSRTAFCLTLLILIIWAIVGIVLGAPDNWQIVMQDGSSIQCYISDTLLMRQQHNHCNSLVGFIAQLQSRNKTCRRLLDNPKIIESVDTKEINRMSINDNVGDAVHLPTENWFDIACNWVSDAVGSLTAWAIYWGGIFAWVGVGHMLGWSDLWQLYINTAVAVELTFTSMFLQNTRRRHMEYLEKCLKSIMQSDSELEVSLREISNDNEPNPIITVQPPKVTLANRSIDYYADVIGSGVGVFISCCVFATWLAVGNLMEWSSNWWLIIGTYTGLIGFLDGFVLRNVYFRQDNLIDNQFDCLIDGDEQIYQFLNLPLPTKPLEEDRSLRSRFSNWMGYMCSKAASVGLAVIVIIVLICVASAMQWSETGQLICNTPTMIIEGFLLVVLIQGHNISNIKRRVILHDIFIRRLKLLQYVQSAKYCGCEFCKNSKLDRNRKYSIGQSDNNGVFSDDGTLNEKSSSDDEDTLNGSNR
ncbi:Low affinity iron permease-domain-containing protein [Pilaira anomala]|nr:Low affinity iron permease-domain-containing protein [Pilaira anomala]